MAAAGVFAALGIDYDVLDLNAATSMSLRAQEIYARRDGRDVSTEHASDVAQYGICLSVMLCYECLNVIS